MMGHILIAAAIVTLAMVTKPALSQHTFVYPKCAPPNTTVLADYLQANGTQMPALPHIPETFQVRVEANILDKNMTVVATEYYDKPNARAALLVITNNTEDYMIFDYERDQLLYDVYGICYAKPLSTNDNSYLFGMGTDETPSAIPHTYNTANSIHFAKANGLTYMGRQVIRGIICDWWQSCMYWPGLYANFTLDYYFSAPEVGWLEPDNSQSVPIRAEIKGLHDEFQLRKFHHIYEYFDFRHSIWSDDTVFQTPAGVPCKRRKKTRDVPVLSNQYSYKEEIILTKDFTIAQTDVYYDFTYKLVRFDYKPTAKTPPYYATNPVTEIHDYASGVAYCIDQIMGNCTIVPLANQTFGSTVNVSVNANKTKEFYIKMKSPQQLFFLDNTSYTYEGQRTVRGIHCDVFISKRKDFHLSGYVPFDSTFEFYFLSKIWFERTDTSNRTFTDVPIQLVISTPDWVGYQATYNIYNFDEEDPSFNRFDITPCFNMDNSMPFMMTFPGSFDSSFEPYRKPFISKALSMIEEISNVGRIRIQRVMVRYDANNLYFAGVLMDLPPPLTFFRKLPGQFNVMTNDATITAKSAADCAKACNALKTLKQCNSFDYCASNTLCSLSRIHADHGSLVKGSTNCDHYDRTIAMETAENALPKAWANLENMVLEESFAFHIPQSIHRGMVFKALRLDAPPKPGTPLLPPPAVVVSKFTEQTNRTITMQDLIVKVSTVAGCAEACLKQQAWVCNAFTYCSDIGFCTLTKQHPDVNPSMVRKNDYCSAFTKKYTVDYNKLEGHTVLSNSDTIYQKINSADLCAQLCSNYDGFNCKSFDYCDLSSTCYLSKSHYYDVPLSDVKGMPSCDHYSRNYLADFTKTTSQTFTNAANRIIQNISVEACAKLCVEQEAMDCASFDYCANMTTCRLTTDSMSNVGQVSFAASFYCDIYSRQTFPDGTPYVQGLQRGGNTITSSSSSSGQYSGGAMAGLGFAMLILGILMAAVVYIAYQKYKGTAADSDIQMHFVKAEND